MLLGQYVGPSAICSGLGDADQHRRDFFILVGPDAVLVIAMFCVSAVLLTFLGTVDFVETLHVDKDRTIDRSAGRRQDADDVEQLFMDAAAFAGAMDCSKRFAYRQARLGDHRGADNRVKTVLALKFSPEANSYGWSPW